MCTKLAERLTHEGHLPSSLDLHVTGNDSSDTPVSENCSVLEHDSPANDSDDDGVSGEPAEPLVSPAIVGVFRRMSSALLDGTPLNDDAIQEVQAIVRSHVVVSHSSSTSLA